MAEICTQCGAVLTSSCCEYCKAPISISNKARRNESLHTHKLNRPYTDTVGAVSYAISVGAVLAISFAAVFMGAGIFDIESVGFGITVSLLFQGAFTFIYFFHTKAAKTTAPAYNIKFKIHPMWYAASVVLGIVCLIFFIGITMVFINGLEAMGLNLPNDPMVGQGIATDILVVFTVVIAASIGEELIFRGSLLSGLIKRVPIPAAAVMSGILFSLMHMSPVQTVYQFFLGFAAAYLVIYSKSVVPGIIIHAVSNGLVILMSFWGGLGRVFDGWAELIFFDRAWGIVLSVVLMHTGVAIIIAGCLLINKFFNKEKVADELWSKRGSNNMAENGINNSEGDKMLGFFGSDGRTNGAGHANAAEIGVFNRRTGGYLQRNDPPKKKSGLFWVWILVPLGVCAIMWLSTFFIMMTGLI